MTSRAKTILAAAGATVAVAAIAVALATGSGNSGGVISKPQPPASKAERGGLPGAVAENLRQANRIIDTPVADKLAALKGTPVVVNQWASWCGPCRAEFPFLQALAKRYRGQVAFLGLNAQDDRGAAARFLAEFPVDYPSIYDRDASQSRSIGAGQGWPSTMFFDAEGERTFVRPGGYASAAALDAEIRRHALG